MTKDGLTRRGEMSVPALVFVFFHVAKLVIFDLLLIESTPGLWILVKIGVVAATAGLLTFVLLAWGGRVGRIILTIGYGIEIIYLLVGYSFYLFFHQYLHMSTYLALFAEGAAAAGHASVPVTGSMLWLLIDLPFLIALLVLRTREPVLRLNRWQGVAVAVVCLSFVLANQIYNDQPSRKVGWFSYAITKLNGETNVVKYNGTLVLDLMSLYATSSEPEMIGRFSYGNPVSFPETTERQSIVVIQVESLDSNVVYTKHDGQLVAPFLSSLAESAVSFPHTVSYHFAGGTSDIEYSTLNGSMPLLDFPALSLSTYEFPNSLARVFAERGYSAMAFHGNF